MIRTDSTEVQAEKGFLPNQIVDGYGLAEADTLFQDYWRVLNWKGESNS